MLTMSDLVYLTCPSCHAKFRMESNPETLPFCSQRCRLADLRAWLVEERSVPHVPDPDDDELPEDQISQD